MDLESAQDWLNRYVAAWLSYEPDEIAALFNKDVSYRYHPFDDPIVGREAVVASWLGVDASGNASTRDAPARTRPNTRRLPSMVTPWWPPVRRGIASCLTGPWSAPTGTAS